MLSLANVSSPEATGTTKRALQFTAFKQTNPVIIQGQEFCSAGASLTGRGNCIRDQLKAASKLKTAHLCREED